MADFNPEKAVLDQIAGISQVVLACSQTANRCEERIAAATQERDAALLVQGFAKEKLSELRSQLSKIREQE